MQLLIQVFMTFPGCSRSHTTLDLHKDAFVGTTGPVCAEGGCSILLALDILKVDLLSVAEAATRTGELPLTDEVFGAMFRSYVLNIKLNAGRADTRCLNWLQDVDRRNLS